MGIIRRTRSKARPPRSSRGFSLIEMLVTLAVLAIVIGLASPLFTTMTNRNRLTGAANETVAAFQIARSEAIRRNVRTVICESVDSVTCRNGSPWRGWIVFTDFNRNNLPDAGEIMRTGTFEQPLVVLTSSNIPNNRVVFRADGLAYNDNALLEANMRVCLAANQPDANARDIAITIGGRVSVKAPVDAPGNTCPAPGNI
ncbi:MAG: GspH/FimT family pseudopilin [Xanthomonadaceae bacterium]|nr:GspH/FimT family pseudopilin [Xanthomonadaceae bacterium]